MRDRTLLLVVVSLLLAALAIAWAFALSDHQIDDAERLILWMLGGTLVLVLYIGWLYTRQHDQLKELREEVKAVHTRHDTHDARTEHAHSKLDKLRNGIALIFRGDEPASARFAKWWASWHKRDDEL